MFDIGMSEILVIAVVAIVVVGPKDLPKLLRTVGKTISGVKRMAGDFQQQFNDAIEESDLADLKDIATGKSLNPLDSIKDVVSDVKNDFMSSLDDDSKKSDDGDAASLFPENETSKRLAKVDAKNEAAVKKTASLASTSKAKLKSKSSKQVSKKAITKKVSTKKATVAKSASKTVSKSKTASKVAPKTNSKNKTVTKRATKSVKT